LRIAEPAEEWPEEFERGKLCREILIVIVNVISEMTTTAAGALAAVEWVGAIVAAVLVAAAHVAGFAGAKSVVSVWIKLTL
jgi:hypothetical protein